MKTKTLYICEFCHASFLDEADAKECESSHKVLYPKTKIVAHYDPITQYGVPGALTVTFTGDGEKPKNYTARYVLDYVKEWSSK